MSATQLRQGLIFEIALAAEIPFRRSDRKCPIRCPLHDDRVPSAFLDPTTNCFHCSVCTPDGGWSAKRFAEALGVPWPPPDAFESTNTWPPPNESVPEFPPALARTVWGKALARAHDDDCVEADAAVYSYLRARGLAETWEDRSFGILAVGMDLPVAISRWPGAGYRLIAPLYDSRGEVAGIQARAIVAANPKTLFPIGSRVKGKLFANAGGIEVLRGTWRGEKRVLLGEGMTDYVALATVSPVPVLAAPGTSMAESGVSAWVKGYSVLLALDWDEAGHNAAKPTSDAAYHAGAVQVRRAEWPHGLCDACDVVQRDGLDGLASFLLRAIEKASP